MEAIYLPQFSASANFLMNAVALKNELIDRYNQSSNRQKVQENLEFKIETVSKCVDALKKGEDIEPKIISLIGSWFR